MPDAIGHLKVSDLISDSGSWNLQLFHIVLPRDILRGILTIPRPTTDAAQDKLIWSSALNGTYSARSGYDFVTSIPSIGGDFGWRWLWKMGPAQKHKVFVWIAAWDRLLNNVIRYDRNLCNSPLRPRCGSTAGSQKQFYMLYGIPSILNLSGWPLCLTLIPIIVGLSYILHGSLATNWQLKAPSFHCQSNY